MTTYGLTASGFVLKSQAVIAAEITASLQAVFGQNINTSPESNFGQFINIQAEREALIWQLAQAVYSSQFPAGAEGTSVDNLLALNNLRRLTAQPTRTAAASVVQNNGVTLFPLVLFGTPGTLIPAGSLIQTNASPPLQFTLDSAVTIQAASNAVQSIYFSNTPDAGVFTISIVDSFGNTVTTANISWEAIAAQTLLGFTTLPAASTSFELTLTQGGVALTTAAIVTNGAYPTSAAIQSAIQALSGYSAVTVSGSAGSYTISWGSIANPLLTVTANTTTSTITPIDSVQAKINNLFDSGQTKYPFTDCAVTVNASGFNVLFGNMSPLAGQPTSGLSPQPLFLVASNSLMMGINVTNIQVVTTTTGAAAQGTGSATCTVTGPNFVAAGSLNTIGSPQSGWTGVDNELDCITGTTVEDDTQAIVRRSTLLNENANGPLLAIIEKVSVVPNVLQSIGFQNLNGAALQILTFSGIPGSGAYVLGVSGYPTASIPYNANAGAIQTAIRNITQFATALVTGNQTSGFTIDFNGSLGGQEQPLISINSNTTGVTLTTSYGRPGKSVEMVVQGGDNTAIAEAILASKPAGIQTYGGVSVQVFDSVGNSYIISFSRPQELLIYGTLTMVTDLYNVPGNPGSGINPQAKFNPASVATIQDDWVAIGSAFPIGGTVIGFGSNGLIGCFNSVEGIISYTLNFGTAPSPSGNANISLLPEQIAIFETFNLAVSYT